MFLNFAYNIRINALLNLELDKIIPFAKQQTFCNHKTICGARNPAYCKCAVKSSAFVCQHIFIS